RIKRTRTPGLPCSRLPCSPPSVAYSVFSSRCPLCLCGSFLWETSEMAKQLLYTDDARKKLLAGAEKLSNAVGITLGRTGRNVILDRSFGGPTVTKDGVTVSKEIDLPDPFENMGAKLVNAVAQKTSDVAGDGTTTATILALAIYQEGLRIITAGANPM